MANFNVNQVRQFYVAKTSPAEIAADTNIASTLDTPGDFGYSQLDADGNFYFISRGANGELVRSDMINAKSIKHITYTDKSKDLYPLKRTKIQMLSTTNSGNPVAGEDYVLVLNFKNILGFGIEDTQTELGCVHATTGMTANQLLGQLAVSLYQNTPKGIVKIYCGTTEITDAAVAAHVAGTTPITGSSVTIEEVEQPWVRGTKAAIVYPFDVTGQYITVNNDRMPWANITVDTPTTSITNTKKIADLEYFCMGERGDWYRNVGWPHVVPTTYLIPADGSTDADGYNVLTIHYKFIGGGDEAASRLSVKDIQIASTQSLEALKGVIEGYISDAFTGSAAESGSTASA